MSSGTFRVPTDEYRFTTEHASAADGQKLYIDPSIWCIHGKYEAFEKYVVAKSNLTAHLAQVHPFTLGWIADLHSGSNCPDNVKEQINNLALCNPTLTVFGGDIVSGSGEYLGSDMEDSWFGNVWDYAKERVSNNLWVKGNHDTDPNRYCYYNWFERLWTLNIGRFKFIAFDGYNEQSIIPGSCEPCLSLPDTIWLRKRLAEDELNKVILVHHPLDQWYPHAPWALKGISNITCIYAGHSHDIIYTKGPYKEISDIPSYINGTCSEGVKLQVATLTLFTRDGNEHTVLVNGGIEVKEGPDAIEITAPGTVNWKKERVISAVPVRLVRCINRHYLNLIVCCPSESRAYVQIRGKAGRSVEITSDRELYVVGKEIYSNETSYDSWTCSCGASWKCYYVRPGRPVELSL